MARKTKPADAGKSAEKIVARLKSIEGHVRGVLDMVGKDAYCIDILRQTNAIESALDRVNALILERHLSHCVSRALRSSDAAQKERVLDELLEVFQAGGRQ